MTYLPYIPIYCLFTDKQKGFPIREYVMAAVANELAFKNSCIQLRSQLDCFDGTFC